MISARHKHLATSSRIAGLRLAMVFAASRETEAGGRNFYRTAVVAKPRPPKVGKIMAQSL